MMQDAQSLFTDPKRVEMATGDLVAWGADVSRWLSTGETPNPATVTARLVNLADDSVVTGGATNPVASGTVVSATVDGSDLVAGGLYRLERTFEVASDKRLTVATEIYCRF